MSEPNKIERPKRISKPNLRYQSEVVKAFKNPIKTKFMQKADKQPKSSKQSEGVQVQCSKRATKSRKESGQLRHLTDVTAEKNSSKAIEGNISSIAATKIKSLIEAANEVKVTTESQNTFTSDILTTQALKDNQPKKIRLTCKQHKRKLKKSKKFIIDCSDVNFIDVNDVVRILLRVHLHYY